MSRAFLPGLLLLLLILVGLALLRGELLVLAIPFALYLATGLLFGPGPLQLEADRVLSADRVEQDDEVEVRLSLTNKGAPLELVVAEEVIPPGVHVVQGQAVALTGLPTGGTLVMEYTLRADRGHHSLPAVEVRASDRFGLSTSFAAPEAPGSLVALPRVERLPSLAFRPRRTLGFSGQYKARRGGSGVEFFGVREFRPGDSLRRVNSRASSRHPGKLFVNEFEQERSIDVGLILDARRAADVASTEGSLFEHAVEATATLAESLLEQGNRVGLLIYGGPLNWTLPGYGREQRERIRQALACTGLQESQAFEGLEYLPTRLFAAGSQLVFVSPLRPDDLHVLTRLRANGYRLVVASPDPIAFEEQSLIGRPLADLAARIARLEWSHLHGELRRAGVPVVSWRVGTPFREAMRSGLSRPLVWARGPKAAR